MNQLISIKTIIPFPLFFTFRIQVARERLAQLKEAEEVSREKFQFPTEKNTWTKTLRIYQFFWVFSNFLGYLAIFWVFGGSRV